MSSPGRYPAHDSAPTDTHSAVDQAAPPTVGRRPREGMSAGTKVALGVGAAALVLAAIGVVDSIGRDEPSTANGSSSTAPTVVSAPPSTATEESEPDMPAPAGSAVRDGKFEFQVLGAERWTTPSGDTFGAQAPKGEFFTVKLRVTNIGANARSFSAANQKLIIDGEEYKATRAGDGGWLEDIKPGVSAEARVTFDIPAGAQPQAIELHDSILSGGTLLAL